MNNFNIDEFLDSTFKSIKQTKKTENKTENVITFPKQIDMSVYDALNIGALNSKNKSTEDILKPLFPNEELFLSTVQPDKTFVLDKFVKDPKLTSKKKQMKSNLLKDTVKKLKEDKTINYSELLFMNDIWSEYINNLINKNDSELAIASKMLKADLHGALIKVVKSTNANNLGIEGLVIYESKRTINILNSKNKVKTILKNGNVFEIKLNDVVVQILGDNFIYKSSERTKIKFKPKYNLKSLKNN